MFVEPSNTFGCMCCVCMACGISVVLQPEQTRPVFNLVACHGHDVNASFIFDLSNYFEKAQNRAFHLRQRDMSQGIIINRWNAMRTVNTPCGYDDS